MLRRLKMRIPSCGGRGRPIKCIQVLGFDPQRHGAHPVGSRLIPKIITAVTGRGNPMMRVLTRVRTSPTLICLQTPNPSLEFFRFRDLQNFQDTVSS